MFRQQGNKKPIVASQKSSIKKTPNKDVEETEKKADINEIFGFDDWPSAFSPKEEDQTKKEEPEVEKVENSPSEEKDEPFQVSRFDLDDNDAPADLFEFKEEDEQEVYGEEKTETKIEANPQDAEDKIAEVKEEDVDTQIEVSENKVSGDDKAYTYTDSQDAPILAQYMQLQQQDEEDQELMARVAEKRKQNKFIQSDDEESDQYYAKEESEKTEPKEKGPEGLNLVKDRIASIIEKKEKELQEKEKQAEKERNQINKYLKITPPKIVHSFTEDGNTVKNDAQDNELPDSIFDLKKEKIEGLASVPVKKLNDYYGNEEENEESQFNLEDKFEQLVEEIIYEKEDKKDKNETEEKLYQEIDLSPQQSPIKDQKKENTENQDIDMKDYFADLHDEDIDEDQLVNTMRNIEDNGWDKVIILIVIS